MTDPMHAVHEAEGEPQTDRWTGRLIVFLRIVAVISMAKGLYHWSQVLGITPVPGGTFDASPAPWAAASIYFAVIDLVAGVGLWLIAAWGAVVWLTAVISMAAVELFFPQVFGGRMLVVLGELVMLGCYFALAIAAGREHVE